MMDEIKDPTVCTCGRSATGFCTGLHALTAEQYDRQIQEGYVYPGEEPKEIRNDRASSPD